MQNKETMKSVYICFGRYQPLTRGHVSHFVAMQHASNDDETSLGCYIATSFSQDNVQNPLPLPIKLPHIWAATSDFGVKKLNVFCSRDPFQAVIDLVDFHGTELTHIYYCAGGDYFTDPSESSMFDRLQMYIDKYTDGRVQVVPHATGERVEGISGTDMRLLAWTKNWDEFVKRSPVGIGSYSEKHAKEAYAAILKSEVEREIINNNRTSGSAKQ